MTSLVFEDIQRKRSGQAPFASVRFEFPKVRLVEGRFGDGKVPDAKLFFGKLFAQAEAASGAELEHVVGYWTNAARAPRLRLFAYRRDRRILGLEIGVDKQTSAWMSELTKNYGSDRPAITFTLHTNGHSMGRLNEKDLSALEDRSVVLAAKRAPETYRRADEAKLKAAYLAKLSDKRPRPRDTDEAALGRAWGAFLKARKARGKKCTDKTLDACAKRLGFELPPALAVLYRQLDGAAGLFFGHDLWSLAELEAQTLSWRSIFDEWTLADLRGNTRGKPGVTNDLYACPLRIPFVDLGGGNHLAVDLLPGPKGAIGQIIVAGRDVETIRSIAPDMKAFVEECLAFDGKSGPLFSVFGELAF
jgi:cell wall assembly regulator SMI1